MKHLPIGLESYSLSPLRLDPMRVIDWAGTHGGEGVQFSEVCLPAGRSLDAAFLAEISAAARERGLYLEWGGGQHIPFDTTSWVPKEIFEINRRAAEQAHMLGTRVVRSCSGGLMRWTDEAPPTDLLVDEMARRLREQRSMLEDHGVVLAIELHFEFTTFELVRLFERIDAEPGGPFGICLDTMNMLTMLEDPLEGCRRVLPWVVATHIKDGAMMTHGRSLVSFPVPLGCGQVPLESIVRLLAWLDRPVTLSVEDHGGWFLMPVEDPSFLARFPDLSQTEEAYLHDLARQGRRQVEEGRLRVTEREDWPACCEERVAADLEGLERIVARVEAEMSDANDRPGTTA